MELRQVLFMGELARRVGQLSSEVPAESGVHYHRLRRHCIGTGIREGRR